MSKDVEKDGVEYITGHARFVDKNTLSVAPTYPADKAHGGSDQERRYTADRIVIAVGGTPTLPKDIPGHDLGFDSDGFFYLEDLPKRAVIVGAGYIAVELAGVLHTLGAYERLSSCSDDFADSGVVLSEKAPRLTSSSVTKRSSRRSTLSSKTRSRTT